MSKHTLITTIGVGDPDLGAEVEVKVAFNFTPGRPETPPAYSHGGMPAESAEIEFLKAEPHCNGKPSPFYGAFADMEQDSLDGIAEAWLATDAGRCEALERAADDHEAAREYASELRAHARPRRQRK